MYSGEMQCYPNAFVMEGDLYQIHVPLLPVNGIRRRRHPQFVADLRPSSLFYRPHSPGGIGQDILIVKISNFGRAHYKGLVIGIRKHRAFSYLFKMLPFIFADAQPNGCVKGYGLTAGNPAIKSQYLFLCPNHGKGIGAEFIKFSQSAQL